MQVVRGGGTDAGSRGMNETNSLVVFTKAAVLLAEANTIQKAKELQSLALTAADWAKRKHMGEDAIHHCRGYALEAERKMGQLLAQTDRAQGKRADLVTKGNQVKKQEIPTLSDLGLTKRDSVAAQALAALPSERFEQIKQGDLTRTECRRETLRAQTRQRAALPTAKFRVLYADPPWHYGDQLTDKYGATKFHYPTLTIPELCAIPIRDRCESHAVLFLWVTSPLLYEAAPLIGAWGFEYKTSFVWDKLKHNMGHYNSVRHEFLLVCTRGSCTPDVPTLFDSVQAIARTDRHSEKPDEFRRIIDTLYPHGKRLEIFARAPHENWEVWGNDASLS
jgi:N6-adenosine-specific RNA methylase IME4